MQINRNICCNCATMPLGTKGVSIPLFSLGSGSGSGSGSGLGLVWVWVRSGSESGSWSFLVQGGLPVKADTTSSDQTALAGGPFRIPFGFSVFL